ncbi:MAG: SUMF1/EgtB/PvdO family nonheme iron enzyme, partial [Nitrospira sp.]|nr:SUMF1/EgtB/PvdO family nonheme iron enzyme [Nitrospira sp.]
MAVRRILGLVLAGFCALSPTDGLTSATESRTAKPESPSTNSLKPDVSSTSGKPLGSNGDSKNTDKIKPVANAIAQTAHTESPAHEHVGKDGAPMVLVPEGDFIMGSDKGDEDEAPTHRVHVNTFYIDKFEVTNGRFAKY